MIRQKQSKQQGNGIMENFLSNYTNAQDAEADLRRILHLKEN